MPLARTHTHTHKTLSSRKSQSAMEYLMTYGWAILIIAVVLGVLFQLGVFSGSALTPKAQPGSCQVQRLLGQVSLEGQCTGLLPEFVAQFGGANGYISAGQIAPQTFTIAAWESSVFASPTDLQVASKWTGLSGWFLEINPSYPGATAGAMRFSIYYAANAINLETGNIHLNNGAWHQVVGVYNGVTLAVYANGTLVTSTSYSGGWASPVSPFEIGAAGGGSLFTGSIADVQLYNASLSANEVSALYLEGIGGAPIKLQNLVGWWPLNGDAKDYSGNNNNGQIDGGVSFNSSWNSQYTPP